jgi:hypothetical protein
MNRGQFVPNWGFFFFSLYRIMEALHTDAPCWIIISHIQTFSSYTGSSKVNQTIRSFIFTSSFLRPMPFPTYLMFLTSDRVFLLISMTLNMPAKIPRWYGRCYTNVGFQRDVERLPDQCCGGATGFISPLWAEELSFGIY